MRNDRTNSETSSQRLSGQTHWVALLSTLGGIIGGLIGILVGAWSAVAVAAFAGDGVPGMTGRAKAIGFLGIIVGVALGAIVGVMIQATQARPEAIQPRQPGIDLRVPPRSQRRRRSRK